MSIDLKLKRVDRVYHPGEKVAGTAVVASRGSLQHNGVTLVMEGTVTLQLSAKSVGLFEAFYSSIKPVQLLHYTAEVVAPGKLPDGVTEIPFEFVLQPFDGQKLHETYHGVFVNIQYTLSVELQRPLLAKNLHKTIEFIVEVPGKERVPAESPVTFIITPESLENVKRSSLRNIPNFNIVGKLDTVVCNIEKPFTGEIAVDECGAIIKSIELQLVRVETCGYADGFAREATEIQNIQVADGDVCRNWTIPLYMVFPRLFTSPTISTRTFKVEFEVNLVVLLHDGHLITENFPIKLHRPPESLNLLGLYVRDA